MRSKVIKLNSELLEKKMFVNKLEEELTLLKRRYSRLQESHRYALSKLSLEKWNEKNHSTSSLLKNAIKKGDFMNKIKIPKRLVES